MTIFWWIFASLAVGGALGMVLGRNPVASLLFLVLTFFSLSAIYILLGAQFIGAIQVILYAGAIMVLFLFVIMLLNLGHDYQADFRKGAWIVLSFLAAGVIGYLFSRTFFEGAPLADRGAQLVDAAVRSDNAVGAIALPLFRAYTLPFEITSVLLLVAVVGAVLLAKRRV